MTSDRTKPSAGFWITVALVAVLVGYPLSFGPACWLVSRRPGAVNFRWLPDVYWPVGWCANQSRIAREAIWGFARIGIRAESDVLVSKGDDWGLRLTGNPE